MIVILRSVGKVFLYALPSPSCALVSLANLEVSALVMAGKIRDSRQGSWYHASHVAIAGAGIRSFRAVVIDLSSSTGNFSRSLFVVDKKYSLCSDGQSGLLENFHALRLK